MPEPTPTPTPTPTPEPPKVTFTPEQQEQVNVVVKDRLARQAVSIREELNKEIEKLREELKGKQTPDPTDPPAPDPEGKEKDKLARDQHKAIIEAEQRKTAAEKQRAADLEKKLKDSESTNERILKHNATQEAMKGIGFHSPEEVELLVDKFIEKSADGKGYVVKVNGVIKENASLEPMTLQEYLREWAATRPWSVSSDLVGGVGSTPGSKSGEIGQVKSKADLKGPKEKSEYIKKFGYDAFEKLPIAIK